MPMVFMLVASKVTGLTWIGLRVYPQLVFAQGGALLNPMMVVAKLSEQSGEAAIQVLSGNLSLATSRSGHPRSCDAPCAVGCVFG
jgi:hypothetical protein